MTLTVVNIYRHAARCGARRPRSLITVVNIYRHSGVWCYAAWSGCEYDHSDTLDAESETDAEAEARKMFPAAFVRRVADA